MRSKSVNEKQLNIVLSNKIFLTLSDKMTQCKVTNMQPTKCHSLSLVTYTLCIKLKSKPEQLIWKKNLTNPTLTRQVYS